jgi:uncharacterized repeat protein (TIGR01451 family)
VIVLGASIAASAVEPPIPPWRPPLFKPGVAHATGSVPRAVAIGDINGDGRKDVVVTTTHHADPANDSRVHVFLQAGSGNLLSPATYPVGTDPTSVDVGDVTGDGRNDVVVANYNGSIGVLAQNAAGTLDPMVSYPTDNDWRVRIGEFNGDGRLDVVSIGWSSWTASVFLQNAGGTLNAPGAPFVDYGGRSDLDVGDVNGDGLTDVVITNGDVDWVDTLSVLLQRPAGGFATPVPYNLGDDRWAFPVAVGDLDGDSRQDVALGYFGDDTAWSFALFLQDAGGTLGAPASSEAPSSLDAIAVGDLNGDGRQDLAFTYPGVYQVGFRLQNADGTLGEEMYPSLPVHASGTGSEGLAIGDVNGDGWPDVVYASFNEGLIVLYHRIPHDVGVRVAVSPDPVGQGSDVTYRIIVTNEGLELATGVTLVDTLPEGIAFVSAHSYVGGCSAVGQVVTCVLGTMAQGPAMAHEVTIVGRATRLPRGARAYRSVARVSASEPDGDPADNLTVTTTRRARR